MNRKLENAIEYELEKIRLNENQEVVFIYKNKAINLGPINYKFEEEKKFKFEDSIVDILILAPEISLDEDICRDLDRILKEGGYMITTSGFFNQNIVIKLRLLKKYGIFLNDLKLKFILPYLCNFIGIFKKERISYIKDLEEESIQIQGVLSGASLMESYNQNL